MPFNPIPTPDGFDPKKVTYQASKFMDRYNFRLTVKGTVCSDAGGLHHVAYPENSAEYFIARSHDSGFCYYNDIEAMQCDTQRMGSKLRHIKVSAAYDKPSPPYQEGVDLHTYRDSLYYGRYVYRAVIIRKPDVFQDIVECTKNLGLEHRVMCSYPSHLYFNDMDDYFYIKVVVGNVFKYIHKVITIDEPYPATN